MLQWARENGCAWDARTCSQAALAGHFDVLRWAFENGRKWDEDTCEFAAGSGRLDLLRWVRANGCPWKPAMCARIAHKSGHKHVSDWISSCTD